jgi:exopolysaccharide production protein ExoZ
MFYNLQALRGLAALLVVFVHLDGPLKPLGDWSDALAFGNAGVDVFFVISGFVMVCTTARKPVTPGAFLLNRAIRVVPLYWGLTLLLFAAALVAPSLLQSTRPDPGDLLRSLAFIPFMKDNGQVAPLFFLGWTLNYEMAFYLVYALALALARGVVERAVLIAVGVMAVAVGLGVVFHPRDAIGHFYTDPMIGEFGLGMVIGLVQAKGVPGRVEGLPAGLCWPMLVGGLAFLLLHPLAGELPHGHALKFTAALIVAAALGLERDGHVLRNPFVQLVGAASYSLYLIHPFITQAGAKLTAHLHGAPEILGVTALCWAATVPAAILVHLAIERPLTDGLRRLVGHHRPVVDRAGDRAIERLASR